MVPIIMIEYKKANMKITLMIRRKKRKDNQLYLEKKNLKNRQIKNVNKICQKYNKNLKFMERSTQEFLKEINFLKSIDNHPYIVNYKESFEEIDSENGAIQCIVLEYAEGGTLQSLIKKDIPEPLALTLLAQICLALDIIHSEDLMHRDLKPTNILISDICKSIPKICDFGSVKIDIEGNPNTFESGTIKYFPPEKQKDQNLYSKKVDVWALGIILYEMLTKGEFIYAYKENSEYRKDASHLELDPNISASCQALIRSMLAKDPANRPSIRDILNNPLIKDRIYLITHQFINGQEVSARITKQVEDIFTHEIVMTALPQQDQGKEEQKASTSQQEQIKDEEFKNPASILPSTKLDEEAQPLLTKIKNDRFTPRGLDELLSFIWESGDRALADAAIYHGLSLERLNKFAKPNREILNLPFEGLTRTPSPDLCPGRYLGQCLTGLRDGYGLLYCKDTEGVPYLFECQWDKGAPQQGMRVLIRIGLWERYEGPFDDKYERSGIETKQVGEK
ncbi:hypothetical protein FGO68_gene13204 [Halteria grandinella]|uniref:non-specific serine/threonine protein kinase n=1 Tax=Halteria grandinella TaxID=5974 RepID=A0A8J8SXV5_HALGN|nr:hypothetical protein FGO68_gene13204 [Halteria grandinella]